MHFLVSGDKDLLIAEYGAVKVRGPQEIIELLASDHEWGTAFVTGRPDEALRQIAVEQHDELIYAPAKPTDPYVRFGQLSFNTASHERWTHGPSTVGRRFNSVEIWAPGWKVCYRQGIAPETYLQVHAVRDGDRFTVMLATAADGLKAAVAPVHQALTELLQPSLVASKRRPWGWTFTDHSYSAPIDSIAPVRLHVDGPPKLREDGPYLRAKPQPWRVLFADGASQRDLASRGGSS